MSVNFKINDKVYKVDLKCYPVDITLNTFIRQHANLTGTKFMCLEGGCGVCICVVKRRHPYTNDIKTWATNSCLTFLNMCDGWEIITVEGIGNKKNGYHPIQTRLAHLNGTQCGYCTPGMVMNMYGLLESKNGQVSTEEIENSFGGNICRCTGYRPILDAMKSFATDSEFTYVDVCQDIEDLSKICSKTGSKCLSKCRRKMVHCIYEDGREWFQVRSVEEILGVFQKIGSKSYMLVAGNTAHGVYRRQQDIDVFIDINSVPELHSHSIDEKQIELGGSISLSEAMEILQIAASKPGFEFCSKLVHHIDLIANVPVRNMGTLAGNLSIKNEHAEFPSDIFILLETIDAKIMIIGPDSKVVEKSATEYADMDMKKHVITKIIIFAKSGEYIFNSYKIMPRAQNAHAYVNAGFALQTSDDLVTSARICFGGINPHFTHAVETENYLVGKKLFSDETIKDAFKILLTELNPDWVLPDTSPQYRKMLACGLFYKFILNFAPDQLIKDMYKSGKDILRRSLSSGMQTFDTRQDMYPITKPIPKIEALVQCSGEASFMNDHPPLPGELWAAFVPAIKANSKIVEIDPREALNIPGVVAFYSAKDIPGKNSFVYSAIPGYEEDEPIFCSDRVQYHSQPLGVIVAESSDLAKLASSKVKVLYEKLDGNIMPTMKEVFENKAFHRVRDYPMIMAKSKSEDLSEGTVHVQGTFDVGSQYHFTMEPQTCVCIPTEDGMNIYSSSQWMDLTQSAIAQSLGVLNSKMFLQVRRLGGGYGAKISRNIQVACACALACHVLNRPVRFVQSIESMMSSLGKRFACHSDYEVNISPQGKIVQLVNTFYEDVGSSQNENPIFLAMITAANCYDSNKSWKINGTVVKTDAPSHTHTRAPGSLEGIAMIENIMEHIACISGKDPAEIRQSNLKPGNKMNQLLPEFLKTSEYKKRKNELAEFNNTNRWCKKGLGLSLMQFPTHYYGTQPVTVSIYHADGSVSVGHGGIEMGQGLNTKVAQVVAYTLSIPLESIQIRPSNTFNAPNAFVTGGSTGSETVCYAAKKACETLLERMKPFRDSLKNPKWSDVVRKCFEANVSLQETHTHKSGDLATYDVYGLCLTEVEVDILTGNSLITRVDILEDTGESLSPSIDIGQIEGAFIMGIGYWLTEKLVFNRQTGELLTNRTWNYKPPGAKDIPIDFRITLLQNSPNPAGFLRSKTTGEPASCLAISVLFALRHALNSSRADCGVTEKWFHLGSPTTPEDIVLNSGTSVDMFTLS